MTKEELEIKIHRCKVVLEHAYTRRRVSEIVISIMRYYQKLYYQL